MPDANGRTPIFGQPKPRPISHGMVGEPDINGRNPIYAPWTPPTIPPGMVGDDPASRPAPAPTPGPVDPNITGPPGESSGRNYGSFRKISQIGGPENRPSNTAELIRRAAMRRLGIE